MKVFKKKIFNYLLIIFFLIIIIYFIYKLYSLKENFKNNREYNIYISASHEENGVRLGDSLFVLIYLYNNKKYIVDNNIIINFYIRSKFIEQIKEFNCCPNNIKFYDIDKKPSDAIDWWIGNEIYENSASKKMLNNKMPLDKYLPLILSEIGEKMNLPPIDKFIYEDTDLLNIYNNLEDKYKNLDILIINGSGGSAKVNISKEEWDTYIIGLSKKYKIITTEKVNNILCTRDYNLSPKTIAAISTHVNYIIAINSGPIVGCFNTYTLNNIKKFFVFDNTTYYSNDKFINVKNFNDINL